MKNSLASWKYFRIVDKITHRAWITEIAKWNRSRKTTLVRKSPLTLKQGQSSNEHSEGLSELSVHPLHPVRLCTRVLEHPVESRDTSNKTSPFFLSGRDNRKLLKNPQCSFERATENKNGIAHRLAVTLNVTFLDSFPSTRRTIISVMYFVAIEDYGIVEFIVVSS